MAKDDVIIYTGYCNEKLCIMYTVLFMHMYVDITYECVYVEIGKSREHYI